MSKIIIPFNNKNFSVDESSLSAATSALRTHLSSAMNGSGATINFGGSSYNVDSAKLSAARNAFVSHLGTIAGSGAKVKVNGVEYNVSSDKVAGAISELETVLGSLQSGDEGGSQLPEKNEYGFYYNVPYIGQFDNEGLIVSYGLILYEDGHLTVFGSHIWYKRPELFGLESMKYTYDPTTNTIIDEYDEIYEIGDDGNSITISYMSDMMAIADTTTVPHGIYYGDEYISQNGETVVCNEDGSLILTRNGVSDTFVENQWTSEYSGYISGRYGFSCSIDGEIFYVCGYYETNQEIVYHRKKSAPSLN